MIKNESIASLKEPKAIALWAQVIEKLETINKAVLNKGNLNTSIGTIPTEVIVIPKR